MVPLLDGSTFRRFSENTDGRSLSSSINISAGLAPERGGLACGIPSLVSKFHGPQGLLRLSNLAPGLPTTHSTSILMFAAAATNLCNGVCARDWLCPIPSATIRHQVLPIGIAGKSTSTCSKTADANHYTWVKFTLGAAIWKAMHRAMRLVNGLPPWHSTAQVGLGEASLTHRRIITSCECT